MPNLNFRTLYLAVAIVFFSTPNWTYSQVGPNCSSECDSLQLLNDFTVNDISDPYQLTFLNNPNRTRLDSLVAQLVEQINSGRDTSYCRKIVDKIGQLKSWESAAFIYTFCIGPWMSHDLNMAGYLHFIIRYCGGVEVLDKYFLNAEISSIELNPIANYDSLVLSTCERKISDIYFCTPVEYSDCQMMQMSRVNTVRFDKKVEKIVRRSKTFKEIEQRILELPEAKDAVTSCGLVELVIPTQTRIGVLFKMEGIQ